MALPLRFDGCVLQSSYLPLLNYYFSTDQLQFIYTGLTLSFPIASDSDHHLIEPGMTSSAIDGPLNRVFPSAKSESGVATIKRLLNTPIYRV